MQLSLLVEFDYGTLQAYQNSSKGDGVLFFTDDTYQLFKGSEEITKTVRLVDNLPPILDGNYGSIYVKCPEKIPYVFDGTQYVPIIKEYTNSLSDASDGSIPTAKAVVDYIAENGGSGGATIGIITNTEIDAMF